MAWSHHDVVSKSATTKLPTAGEANIPETIDGGKRRWGADLRSFTAEVPKSVLFNLLGSMKVFYTTRMSTPRNSMYMDSPKRGRGFAT